MLVVFLPPSVRVAVAIAIQGTDRRESRSYFFIVRVQAEHVGSRIFFTVPLCLSDLLLAFHGSIRCRPLEHEKLNESLQKETHNRHAIGRGSETSYFHPIAFTRTHTLAVFDEANIGSLSLSLSVSSL